MTEAQEIQRLKEEMKKLHETVNDWCKAGEDVTHVLKILVYRIIKMKEERFVKALMDEMSFEKAQAQKVYELVVENFAIWPDDIDFSDIEEEKSELDKLIEQAIDNYENGRTTLMSDWLREKEEDE